MVADKVAQLKQSAAQDACYQKGLAAGMLAVLDKVQQDKSSKSASSVLRKHVHTLESEAHSIAQQRAGAAQGADAILGMLHALARGMTSESKS